MITSIYESEYGPVLRLIIQHTNKYILQFLTFAIVTLFYLKRKFDSLTETNLIVIRYMKTMYLVKIKNCTKTSQTFINQEPLALAILT